MKSRGSGEMHFEHQLSIPTECESVSNLTSLSEFPLAANWSAMEDIANHDIIIHPLTADLLIFSAEFCNRWILAYSRDGFAFGDAVSRSAACIILSPAV